MKCKHEVIEQRITVKRIFTEQSDGTFTLTSKWEYTTGCFCRKCKCQLKLIPFDDTYEGIDSVIVNNTKIKERPWCR